MKDDKLLIALLSIAMLLAIAVVGMNVLTVPRYSPPSYAPAESSVSGGMSSAAGPALPENRAGDEFPININTASADELQRIPNVGPVMAGKIIDFRTQVGTIVDIEELLAVDGIGEKTIEVLKEYCVAE